MKRTTLVLLICAASVAVAKPTTEAFYVYSDKGAPTNHFAPSGWMGSYQSLKLNDAYNKDCEDGKTCIQWKYDAANDAGSGWAGVFWQWPPNNWGEKPGGFDLSNFKRLTFWAKGEQGGENIHEFKVGGITGEHGDSDEMSIGPIVLTKTWKKYTIDLADKNFSHVIGGFCWSASRDDNPNGFTFYLDEIRFEK